MSTFSPTEAAPALRGEPIEVVDPATGQPVATVAAAAPADLDEVVAAAATAAADPAWAGDRAGRAERVAAVGRALAAAARELAPLITSEQGKPLMMATGEVHAAAAFFRQAAAVYLPDAVLRDDPRTRVVVERRPLGVVAAVTPWNFPLAIAAAKVAPALVAGNTVVLKPSPFTPLATLRLAEIAADHLPPGVLTVVPGGAGVGAALVAHRGVAKVTLTGSVATGSAVLAAAAADVRRVTLELGGNDAAIVLDDADVAAVAERVFWAAFANAGQACTAVKRLYVPRRIAAAIVGALAALAASAVVGNGADPASQIGPVTTEAQRCRVVNLVESARADGGRVVCGGGIRAGDGWFHPLTIVDGLPSSSALVEEEQFGPALPVLTYDQEDEAVAAANSTRYGLGASVWSSDVDRAGAVAERLEAGTVWVNGHGSLVPGQPVVGTKQSGIGIECGTWGVEDFTELRVRHVTLQ